MPDLNIYVTRLSPAHKKEILNLVKSQVDIYHSPWSRLVEKLNEYLHSSSIFPVFFGLFEREELMYIMGLEKWEGLPYATITYTVGKRNEKIYDHLKKGEIALLLEKIFRYGEKNGIVAFYAFVKKKSARLRSKMALNSKNYKYFFYTEAVIPKNTKPKEFIYWWMMDRERKPFTGEIRRCMLKPCFLESVSYLSDEEVL